MELEIIISEPWNFKSSDGDNYLKVKVMDDKNGIIIAEAISDYSGKGGYLIITPRNDFGHINICQKLKDGRIVFTMIGKYAGKYKRNS